MFLPLFQKQSYYPRQTIGEIEMMIYITGKARAPPPIFDSPPQSKIKNLEEKSMSNTCTLSVYNTCTGKYENVAVTEEVYREYRRTGWTIENNDASFYDHEIQFSQLIGGNDGAYENFHEFVSDEKVTENAALNAIRIEQLNEILPTLSAKEREVIELLYMDGYSAAEAGSMLGISKQAVNKRKRAAFEKIRTDRRMF